MTPLSILLADLFLKVTLVLAAAHLISFFVRRRSASTRHLILSSALIALLVFPFTALIPSLIEIPLPTATRATGDAPPAERIVLRTSGSSDLSGPEPIPVASASTPQQPQTDVRSNGSTGHRPTSSRQVAVPLLSLDSIASWLAANLTVSAIVGSGWAVGTILLLLHLLTGVLRVQWIVERALPVEDDRELARLRDVCSQIGLNRLPRLMVSPEISVPVVWGLGTPTLLLPIESESWTDDRRRAVFLHEIAHVARRDGLTLLLTKLAVALYWVNPLVWTGARMSRRFCERACDDIVLERGTKASEYADHLLAIARELPERENLATVTLAMSRRSEIEGRLLAILHPGLRRAARARSLVPIAAVSSLLLIAGLGSIRLAAQEPGSRHDATPAQSKVEPDLAILVDERSAPPADGVRTGVHVPVPRSQFEDENPNWNTNWNTNRNTNSDETRNENSEYEVSKERRIERKSKDERRKQVEGSSAASTIWEKAWNAHQDDRFEESIPLFMKTAELGYRPDASRYNVACGYAMMGDTERALDWLRRAVDHGFDRWELIADDADLDPIRSEPSFQSLVDSLPVRQAVETRQRSRIDKALQRFEELRASNSSDASEWGEAGLRLLRLRMLDDAEYALRRAIDLGGSRAVIPMYNMACVEALRGDVSESLRWLDEAIESGLDRTGKIANDPDLNVLRGTKEYDLLIRKSQVLSLEQFMKVEEAGERTDETARWRPAIDLYARYTSRNPSSGRAWWNLAYAQHMSGIYLPAIGGFERAIQLGYRPANSSYNIACAHARLGHTDLAFQWLERAAQLGFDLGDRIRWDDDLTSLRDDPRVETLFERTARTSK